MNCLVNIRSVQASPDGQFSIGANKQLWRIYMMLTDLEAVFHCFKSDLGFWPIFHSKEERADSHLLITVLAYQLVQLIRRRLKESGSNANSSWRTLREIMSTQCRSNRQFPSCRW